MSKKSSVRSSEVAREDSADWGSPDHNPMLGEKNGLAVVSPEVEDESKREGTESSLDFYTIPEKLAHSRIHYRNVTVSELVLAFPFIHMNHTVDFYYPNAQGGPLYIDEALHPFDVEVCQAKMKVMRRAGYRYVYLEKDTKFDAALLMLEGKL